MTDSPEPDDYFSIADILPEAPPIAPTVLPALEKLGPSPFPKSGFPFLGFLATVYDQVAAHVPGGIAPEPAATAPEASV